MIAGIRCAGKRLQDKPSQDKSPRAHKILDNIRNKQNRHIEKTRLPLTAISYSKRYESIHNYRLLVCSSRSLLLTVLLLLLKFWVLVTIFMLLSCHDLCCCPETWVMLLLQELRGLRSGVLPTYKHIRSISPTYCGFMNLLGVNLEA